MRMLHTMLRVGNLEQSLKFYTEVLGMTLLRKRDYEEGRFTLAFVGYGDEENHTVLELTHNWIQTAMNWAMLMVISRLQLMMLTRLAKRLKRVAVMWCVKPVR